MFPPSIFMRCARLSLSLIRCSIKDGKCLFKKPVNWTVSRAAPCFGTHTYGSINFSQPSHIFTHTAESIYLSELLSSFMENNMHALRKIVLVNVARAYEFRLKTLNLSHCKSLCYLRTSYFVGLELI